MQNHIFSFILQKKLLIRLFIQSINFVMIINAKDLPAVVAERSRTSYCKFKSDHVTTTTMTYWLVQLSQWRKLNAYDNLQPSIVYPLIIRDN